MNQESSSKVIDLQARLRRPPALKSDRNGVEYEEEIKAPSWLRMSIYGLFLFVIAFFLFSPFLSNGEGDPMYLLLSLVLTGIAWIIHVFLTFKTTMTSEGIRFGFYSFSKYVPYDDITSCSIMRYHMMDFIGWGVRKGRDGITMYNIVGDQQIAVKIMVREQDGTQKVFAFSAKRPQVVCNRIQAHITPEARKIHIHSNLKGTVSYNRS